MKTLNVIKTAIILLICFTQIIESTQIKRRRCINCKDPLHKGATPEFNYLNQKIVKDDSLDDEPLSDNEDKYNLDQNSAKNQGTNNPQRMKWYENNPYVEAYAKYKSWGKNKPKTHSRTQNHPHYHNNQEREQIHQRQYAPEP